MTYKKSFEQIEIDQNCEKKTVKATFYNIFIWAWNENLKSTLYTFMLIVYMMKISSKSVYAETSNRHRKMNKNVNLLQL